MHPAAAAAPVVALPQLVVVSPLLALAPVTFALTPVAAASGAPVRIVGDDGDSRGVLDDDRHAMAAVAVSDGLAVGAGLMANLVDPAGICQGRLHLVEREADEFGVGEQ